MSTLKGSDSKPIDTGPKQMDTSGSAMSVDTSRSSNNSANMRGSAGEKYVRESGNKARNWLNDSRNTGDKNWEAQYQRDYHNTR